MQKYMKHNTNMKKTRDFHKQVRVVYRACRKIYGKEKTQDECLRIFKVVFPELLRLKASENERETLNESIRPAIEAIFKSWRPQKKLRELCDRVDNLIGLPFDYERTKLMELLEDITPVAMRIRKLTPTETGRLMGLRDEEIQKMYDAGLSNSAMYKLHGNSIVVNVMTAIFDKLLVNTKQDEVPGMQLSLF